MEVRATSSGAAGSLRDRARPLDEDGFEELVHRLAGRRLVLIGEASHGTAEFYATRAALTRRLIDDHGFTVVAIEGDWPDAAQLDAWIRDGVPDDHTVAQALSGFARFPRWMWRNTVVAEFATWARSRDGCPRGPHLVGLDLYSLHRSIEEVLSYLERTDPDAAQRARARYACFDHTAIDGARYGHATATGRADPCEDAVVEQLVELLATSDGAAHFSAQQNARLVANAERYYRAMYRGREMSWNLRDDHMVETLDAVRRHVGTDGSPAKTVVWAHNSHLGDARATEMAARGEHNVGQLCRQRYGDDVVLVGMTTHTGEVTAASDWDGFTERKRVRDSLPGSVERLLHEVGHERFWLDLHDEQVRRALAEPGLERMIGVIYRPESERVSHYVEAVLPDQFDLVVHLDRTSALRPLDPALSWQHREETPQTYPWAV